MGFVYGMIGRELCGGTRDHGPQAIDEHNGAAMIDRAVRRLSVLLGTSVVRLTLIQVVPAQAEPMPVGVSGTWSLKLNEEFTSAGLNTALWTPGWQHSGISGPMSGQCLSSAFVSQPGSGYLDLYVKAQHNTCESTSVEDTGGLIESNPSDGVPGHTGFSYSYGYVEWRVFLPGVSPKGLGCPSGGCLPDWPALWSLSSSSSNELDTMEGLGSLGQACYHVHPPPGGEGPGGCASGSYAGWHTYGTEWEPGVARYYYDGTKVGEVVSGEVNSTPQYLIADLVPPGCCGGPLVLPDEMTIDYVRVWQHPAPPTVKTQAATELAPLQARLTGRVNPNGADTHYYFQYGKTTSYGSSTGESDAGSGWNEVGASITATGLEPGTTYHYRIVATNSAGGPIYGEDGTFTTPSKPEAVTNAASGIQETKATLHGTVNPKGYDGYSATYHFEYGSTASYGTSVPMPECNAGSGTTPVTESASLTGLEPGATYHYRLVASNAWGTSYGSDTTFNTPEMEVSSGSAVRDANSGDQWVYYTNSTGGLSEWNWDSVGWHGSTLGGSIKVGTRPTVVRDHSSGFTWIYYVNTSGEVAEWYWNGSWNQATLGGSVEAGTSPSVVREPVSGDIWVYYVNSSGGISQWAWSGSWNNGTLGGSVKAGTSPTVVRDPYSGDQWVYYVNSSGGISEWNWNSTTWQNGTLGGSVNTGTSPTVLREPHSGEIWVYYTDSSEAVSEWHWNGSAWRAGMGGVVEPETSPSAIGEPDGDEWVYYVNSSGISEWNWNTATWQTSILGGNVKAGTSPATVRDASTGDQWVYYVNSSGGISQWTWSGSWNNGTLGGGVKAGTSPSVIRDASTGDQWVYYVNGSGGISEWNWNSATWQNGTLGGSVKAGASPTVVREPSSGVIWVYYVNSSGGISEWYWNGSWNNVTLGGSVAAGTSPSVVRDASSGDQWVYYVNSSGGISQWAWSGSWNNGTLGGSVAADTTPTVVRNASSGDQWVYYVNSSDGISEWNWNGSTWQNGTLGGNVEPGTSPSVARENSSGHTRVHYVNSSLGIAEWIWNGTAWETQML